MGIISGKSTVILQLVIFRGYDLRGQIQIVLDEEDNYTKSRGITINTKTEGRDVPIAGVSCTAHPGGRRGRLTTN